MNYEQIILYFLPSEYEVQPLEINGRDCLLVSTQIANRMIELVHICVPEITCLPCFLLKDAVNYGELAHVIPPIEAGMGFICINDPDSVSVNFDRPELAFEESLKRHIDILKKAIGDPEWNHNELLREFKPNWARGSSIVDKKLLCVSRSGQLEKVQIFNHVNRDAVKKSTCYIGISESNNDLNAAFYLQEEGKRKPTDGIGYVIPLASLAPAPQSDNVLADWYIDALSRIPPKLKDEFERSYAQFRSKRFWLVFNAPTPSGVTWFGLRLTSPNKNVLPRKYQRISNWKFERLVVDVFNKELIMPRSGANPILDDKRVLLVGCGSVGSELALKLGSSGLGKIDLSDPDIFTSSNLFRHTLNKYWIGSHKSQALASELTVRFPWIGAKAYGGELLGLRYNKRHLEDFDLIIIAIGSPTHERLFHKFLVDNKIKVPVINTWLEGYGIGGHATLDIPGSKGCLRCTYVETDTGARGLASNLNFFESDQNIVKNYAGCGETFLPYGAISSAQTALIASNLAIRYLEGKIKESKKVSWKGDSADAIEHGIKLTPRYDSFNQSLTPTPLYNPKCDLCRGEPGASYEGTGIRIHVAKDVLDMWQDYRQLKPDSVESAGLLIGHLESETVIWIDGITKPKVKDINHRSYFKLDDKGHQAEIDQVFAESLQKRGYLGTWHTHPQEHPTPSSLDRYDWRKHVKDNTDRPLLFVVIGTQSTKIFTLKSGQFVNLNPVV